MLEKGTFVDVPAERWVESKSCAAAVDFFTESLLLYPPKEDSTLLMKILEPAGIRPRKVLEVTLTEAIIEMIIGGLGVARLPKREGGPQPAFRTRVGVSVEPPGWRWARAVARIRAH